MFTAWALGPASEVAHVKEDKMLKIIWSKINQAYFIMWNDSVLAVQPTKADAISWMSERGIKRSEYTINGKSASKKASRKKGTRLTGPRITRKDKDRLLQKFRKAYKDEYRTARYKGIPKYKLTEFQKHVAGSLQAEGKLRAYKPSKSRDTVYYYEPELAPIPRQYFENRIRRSKRRR